MTESPPVVQTLPSTNIELPMQLNVSGGFFPFTCERFALRVIEDAQPFLRMEAVEEDLAFHLLDPFLIMDSYAPEISDEDDALLDLKGPEDTLLLSVVNLNREDGRCTVNLAAPLAINLRTGRAKQVVLNNAAHYSVRHGISG